MTTLANTFEAITDKYPNSLRKFEMPNLDVNERSNFIKAYREDDSESFLDDFIDILASSDKLVKSIIDKPMSDIEHHWFLSMIYDKLITQINKRFNEWISEASYKESEFYPEAMLDTAYRIQDMQAANMVLR